MGKPAARIGDMHMCPMVTPGLPPIPHVGGPITGPGVPTVLIGGIPAATMGDMCTCVGPPDTIILGSTGVFIGGKPAARMGDQCVHGGAIAIGCPTVLIGETMAGGGGSVNAGIATSGTTNGGLAAIPNEALKKVMKSAPPETARKIAQVIALKEAAKDGTPFCEKCEETLFK
ncbi:MAG TPA: PAAR domain-containing protein [Flavisolibacter sp.]|nr:PAAR domain-containing protein [Flavisolibacter sp.]